MTKNPKVTQGSRAVKTGNALERVVLHALNDNNYTFIPPKKFLAACCLPQPLYTKQIYATEGIYGYMLRHDFMLYHPEKWPNKLIIECKWQQGRGSVDEKYPYNVLNIQEKYLCPAIILLDGAGFRSGAGAWLRAQVDRKKLLHVFSMMEFQTWVNNDNL
jgi:DNA adenine methylase